MEDVDLPPFLESVEELLAVRSTADRPDELHRALDFVVDYVSGEFGGGELVVERFESNGKPSALIYRAAAQRGRADGRPEFRVILNAHLDVVPAEPAQFAPRRTGDRLYARGAHDMKVTGLVQARRLPSSWRHGCRTRSACNSSPTKRSAGGTGPSTSLSTA